MFIEQKTNKSDEKNHDFRNHRHSKWLQTDFTYLYKYIFTSQLFQGNNLFAYSSSFSFCFYFVVTEILLSHYNIIIIIFLFSLLRFSLHLSISHTFAFFRIISICFTYLPYNNNNKIPLPFLSNELLFPYFFYKWKSFFAF